MTLLTLSINFAHYRRRHASVKLFIFRPSDITQERQCKFKRNNKARPFNYYCCEKATIIKYYVCVCSLSYIVCTAHAVYSIGTCGLFVSAVFFT